MTRFPADSHKSHTWPSGSVVSLTVSAQGRSRHGHRLDRLATLANRPFVCGSTPRRGRGRRGRGPSGRPRISIGGGNSRASGGDHAAPDRWEQVMKKLVRGNLTRRKGLVTLVVLTTALAGTNVQPSCNDTQAINAQSVAVAQGVATAAQAVVNADEATTPPSPTLAADQAALAAANNALAAAKAKAQQSNDQAAASLASARQQLSSAKSSLAALRTSTPASTLQMDEAQIQIAQANLSTTQHQLNGATIKSPIAGVVSQVNVSAGQAVSGGGSGTGTSSSYAIVVYSPGSYEGTGTVSDAPGNLVAVGQTVQVTPAGSTQALQGKVTAISPAATITSGVATFVVTAQLADNSNSIKPGVSATATIVSNQVCHVLTVPTRAVHTTATGSTVQILVNGKPQTVVVTTGASDPTRIQILSGLQLNQTVVIAVISSSVPSSSAGTALGAGGGARGGGGGGATRGGGTGG